jgi:hypothetical protein
VWWQRELGISVLERLFRAADKQRQVCVRVGEPFAEFGGECISRGIFVSIFRLLLATRKNTCQFIKSSSSPPRKTIPTQTHHKSRILPDQPLQLE